MMTEWITNSICATFCLRKHWPMLQSASPHLHASSNTFFFRFLLPQHWTPFPFWGTQSADTNIIQMYSHPSEARIEIMALWTTFGECIEWVPISPGAHGPPVRQIQVCLRSKSVRKGMIWFRKRKHTHGRRTECFAYRKFLANDHTIRSVR